MTTLGNIPPASKLRLAILLLAAGEGSRLGSIPKALLKKDGESLLKHFCQVALAFLPVQFIVVSGFHAQAIEAELASLKHDIALPIHLVLNTHPELGQSSSVRIGLEALGENYDVLLIALCDQPAIGQREIAALLNQFELRKAGQEIILPMVGEQRGNPVLFSKKVIENILAVPGMVCRPFMDEHSELVHIFYTDNEAYILDVDTEKDIQNWGLQRD
jgi:molybdenum cofactor cytidylyltransferase/nicotine blue oxidoreductase